VVAEQAEGGLYAVELEVPAPGSLLAPAVADRAVRHHRLAVPLVQHNQAPVGVLALRADIAGAQEGAGHERAVPALAQRDQERKVGEAPRVVVEIRHAAVDAALPEDHVPHCHRERAVGAGDGRKPVVGELRVAGIVG
jgi:hypothetical protein